MMTALGVFDLRNIIAVRRAFQLVPRPDPRGVTDWEDSPEFWQLERSEEDDHDVGGDAGLANVSDKSHLRMRRSLELMLTSGGVIRYEVNVFCSIDNGSMCLHGATGFLVRSRFGMDRAPSVTDILLEKTP